MQYCCIPVTVLLSKYQITQKMDKNHYSKDIFQANANEINTKKSLIEALVILSSHFEHAFKLFRR